jgi:hypothetical protein
MRPSGPLDGGASLCGNVALIASKASGVIEIEIMLRRPAYPERAPRAMRVLDPDGREVHSMGDGAAFGRPFRWEPSVRQAR